MSAHTPGPWKVQRYARDNPDVIDARGLAICALYGDMSSERLDAKANARLIAAAPDLYEALRDLLNAFPGDYETPPDHVINASAALAKVGGAA